MQDNSIDMSQNNVMSGWVQTLDLLKDNSINKNSPLDSTYDDGAKALGEEKWGFGLWATGLGLGLRAMIQQMRNTVFAPSVKR